MLGLTGRHRAGLHWFALLLSLAGMCLLAVAGAGTASAKQRHRAAHHVAARAANNRGDVWTDNVGQPAGPGHEQDPHLACADINLWGNGMADGSGPYTIDGWPPSGSQEQVYASTWNYDRSKGGDQVMDVINVQKLVTTAIADGDAPVNKQGFHFKLQFVQDPQKHKTFWVNCTASPAIKVTKLQRDANGRTGGFQHPDITVMSGDTIQYQIQASNTGNTPLKLSLNDPLCDGGTIQGPTQVSGTLTGDKLSSGGVAQYTCSHALTSSDPKPFTNTATVTGTPPSGSPVSGSDQVNANVQTPPPGPAPAISVVKLQHDGSTGAFQHGDITAALGDTINYEIQATNTGNTPLDLSLNDPLCDSGTIQGPEKVSGDLTGNTLAVGGVAQYTCSHTLTSSDANPFTNTATVTGTPPAGSPVSGSDRVNANEQSTPPPPPGSPSPAISVVKLQRDGSTGSFTHDVLQGAVGDTIQYEIQATNTGNTDLTLTLDDPVCDSGTVQGPTQVSGSLNGTTLSPGGEAQYTCSHTLAASDSPAVTNVATVTGTPPAGTPVTGTDQVTTKVPGSTPQSKVPAISVVKLQRDGSTGSFTRDQLAQVKVGDTVQYEIQATNTGNVPLTLSLDDALCDAGTVHGPVALGGGLTGDVLDPSSVAQYTCSHLVKAGDGTLVSSGGRSVRQLVNVAMVTGTPPTGSPVSGTSKVTALIPGTASPTAVLKVIKRQRIGDTGQFTRQLLRARPGQIIEYQLDVITGGTLPMTLKVSDVMCDAGTLSNGTVLKGTMSGMTLKPNAAGAGEVIFTCSHLLKATDGKIVVRNGRKVREFTNVVDVIGTPPTGAPRHGHSTVTLIVRRRPRPKPVSPVLPYRPARQGGHGFTG